MKEPNQVIPEDIAKRLHKALFADLRIGRFWLDAEDRIEWVDGEWMKVYNFDKQDKVLGRPIQDFYADPDRAGELTQMVKQSNDGSASGVYLFRRRVHDNAFEHFFGEVITVGEWEGKEYRGRYGFIRDVTDREIRRRIEEQLPLAFYIARTHKNEDRIIYCNDEFVKLFRFPNKQAALSASVKNLYANPKEHEAFLQRIRQEKGRQILGRKIRVMDLNGREFTIDANIVWTPQNQKGVMERFGMIRDLSKDASFTDTIQHIGIVLHSYQTALIGIRHQLEAFADSLAPDPFPLGELVHPEKAESALSLWLNILKRQIAVLEKEDFSSVERRQFLGALLYAYPFVLSDASTSQGYRWQELLPERLESTHRILEICHEWMEKIPTRRDLLQPIENATREIQRLLLLILLHQSVFILEEVAQEVALFRDYMTRTIRIEEKEPFDLWYLIEQAIGNLVSYARRKDIAFRSHKFFAGPAFIYGYKRSMLRAVTAILHNAVKYSWQRITGGYVRVDMEKIVKDNQQFVKVEIENFGVGIPQEEIDSGKIFQFGYRGALSGERGRVGTGVGLSDAKWVIEQHGGTLAISSRPLQPVQNSADLANTPHLTQVTIYFPLWTEIEK